MPTELSSCPFCGKTLSIVNVGGVICDSSFCKDRLVELIRSLDKLKKAKTESIDELNYLLDNLYLSGPNGVINLRRRIESIRLKLEGIGI